MVDITILFMELMNNIHIYTYILYYTYICTYTYIYVYCMYIYIIYPMAMFEDTVAGRWHGTVGFPVYLSIQSLGKFLRALQKLGFSEELG